MKIVISRSGEIIITDDNGRERERHKVPYGATWRWTVLPSRRSQLATWDPHTRPIITEYAGTVRFENVEGVTVAKQIDEVTGLSTLVVIDPKRRAGAAARLAPAWSNCWTESGAEVKRPAPIPGHHLPGRLYYHREDGQQVPWVTFWRVSRKSRRRPRITGGLPRVAELFEARSPKDAGVLAVTGTVPSARTPRASSV